MGISTTSTELPCFRPLVVALVGQILLVEQSTEFLRSLARRLLQHVCVHLRGEPRRLMAERGRDLTDADASLELQARVGVAQGMQPVLRYPP